MNFYKMPQAQLLKYLNWVPDLGKDVFLASGSFVIGRVTIGDESSVWFNTVVRGDVNEISIGRRTNIQDNCTIHVTDGGNATVIGDGVTVGHQVMLHACTIEDYSLIGMGATLLDGAVIGAESLVGAGSLVTQGKKFPARSLILGNPAKAVRSLNEEEIANLHRSADHYCVASQNYWPLCEK